MNHSGKRVRMGMIGGGDYSLIGNTHRLAASLSGQIELISGVFSSRPEASRAFAAELGLTPERSYRDWEEMLEKELARLAEDRIQGVIVITPNHLHYPIGKAFAEAGFHIIMDKPMVHNSEQAEGLCRIAEEKGIVFAVTYNYTGFPMVKKARDLIGDGVIGSVRKVVVEYSQGWLAAPLEKEGVKKAEWRTDPERSGLAGTIADIGSHAENLSATVTGLDIEEVSADLTTMVAGRKLDDDGNVLIHYRGGARGVMITSQISCGEDNHLSIRVYGEKGKVHWDLADADVLEVKDEAGKSNSYRHTPGQEYHGHGIRPSNLEAFTHIYREASQQMLNSDGGDGMYGGDRMYDYPTVHDGARGVTFIEKVVASSQERRWIRF